MSASELIRARSRSLSASSLSSSFELDSDEANSNGAKRDYASLHLNFILELQAPRCFSVGAKRILRFAPTEALVAIGAKRLRFAPIATFVHRTFAHHYTQMSFDLVEIEGHLYIYIIKFLLVITKFTNSSCQYRQLLFATSAPRAQKRAGLFAHVAQKTRFFFSLPI